MKCIVIFFYTTIVFLQYSINRFFEKIYRRDRRSVIFLYSLISKLWFIEKTIFLFQVFRYVFNKIFFQFLNISFQFSDNRILKYLKFILIRYDIYIYGNMIIYYFFDLRIIGIYFVHKSSDLNLIEHLWEECKQV